MCKPSIIILLLIVWMSNVAFCQRGIMDVTTTAEVHFIVIDPLGRRTGCDPRGNNKLVFVRQIPNANYAISSVGDSPTDYEPLKTDVQHEFIYRLESPQNDGVYIIHTIGKELGWFNLFISVDPEDNLQMQPFSLGRHGLRSLTDKDSVVTYRFEYHGQPGMPIKFEKVVRSNTLRQDLAAAYTLKLLGDQKLFDDWNKEIDKFERDLARKDSAKARRELEKFGKEIDKQREETIKHEQRGQKDKRFITKDAYDILKEDVTILIKQLPEKKEK